MTKAKLHESVLSLCTEFKASKKLTDALSELTKPKIGGGSDVNDYTVFGSDDSVEYVFCTYHKMWEPVSTVVTDEEGVETIVALFKDNDKTKNGFERECLEGSTQWKLQTKTFNASKSAVMEDLLEGAITGPDAKTLLADAESVRALHLVREDGLGSVNRPGESAESAESVDTEEVA